MYLVVGGKQLQVKLTIPWKHNVQIEYLALSVSKECAFVCLGILIELII